MNDTQVFYICGTFVLCVLLMCITLLIVYYWENFKEEFYECFRILCLFTY